ncbi:MAG: hypothetical protein H6R17_3508 [Proteobacteria bacterium]|nr:hypothetical protein [Pseudomonadota bacterium]
MIRDDGLRAALYHRLHFLWPLLANRRLRSLWRALLWSFWLIYFGFVVLVLALRYSVLPHIEDYRADVERLASQALGQSISIGRIEASWAGINPDLTLLDVRVADAEGRPALAFSRIEAVLSWWTVPSAQLKLRLLRIDQPTLNLRRAGDGRIFIAGIPLNPQQSDSDVSDWILAQRRIRIRGATLVWQDELRNAPELVLEDVDLALDNDGNRHRFGLTARPPEALASPIDVRGDFRGSDIGAMESWSGQAYAQIASADLAVWRQWIDYPVALPRGHGGLRAWLGFAQGGLREVTADVALQDVSLRLAEALPALELEQMSGRLAARFTASGFALTGRKIELATRYAQDAESIRVEPTDFHVDWRAAATGQSATGSASASRLDVGALARLAGYLPFDARSRQLLTDYAPQGMVSTLAAKWKGDADHLESYTLKASFDRLALKAQGAVPGFSGLSGVLDASEAGGAVTLTSQNSTIDLPSVFPEPRTTLDTLAAQAKWKLAKSGLEVDLSRVEFAGPDAAGSAQGVYRSAADGPGVIDLSAALTRADARAVWRYMPHAVGKGARLWLRDSLIAGRASEAKLILKGNLADFPFLDKRKGQFLVTVKARDAVIDYAKGWPKIDGVAGDLRFEGNGMVVDAHRGSILGAQLANTRAEIPDFDAPISTLIVKGQAQGPTSEFLKFVEQSPVAERIDHFTDDLRASGMGHLDIALSIPLDETKLGNSKIDGTYRLTNNEVTVDTALPPIKQVNGSVQFSGSDLKVPEISGTLFGGPLKIKGGLQKDGKVLITANGSLAVAQLRKLSDSPLLENVSGATSYRGEVQINKRNADLVIDSTLVGLASTLPEPFAKAAGDSLALHFEKRLLPTVNAEVRDQLSATLGSVLSLQLIRRKQRDGFVSERGAIGVGRPAQMPASGIALGVSAKRLDLDLWRRVLAAAGTAPASASSAPAVDSVNIKADDLLLLGRHFNAVDLAASLTPAQWTIRLASRQASGDLVWDNAGSGKLTARLKQMTIDPATEASAVVAREAVEKLPALDVVADEFALGVRRFGRLELQARNEGGLWHLSKVQMSNQFGNLSGSGQWQIAGGRNRTQLDFSIDSSDVGRLLERLGYPGAVRAGTAQLAGKIGWNGSPADLDFESLSGEMSLEANKGQFVKLDPGAAGKLLGLISLQGLPRRISLDFKDVFSDGLAFDSISSKLAVKSGVMRTERLQIDGPSARVVMRGEVDLKNETQRLIVNVQPELGGTAAIGIALINPIAGVATLLAHKVLQNPLNQMFGFDYLVTGHWDDPKVEKISSAGAAVAVPRLPTISPGASSESSAQ